MYYTSFEWSHQFDESGRTSTAKESILQVSNLLTNMRHRYCFYHFPYLSICLDPPTCLVSISKHLAYPIHHACLGNWWIVHYVLKKELMFEYWYCSFKTFRKIVGDLSQCDKSPTIFLNNMRHRYCFYHFPYIHYWHLLCIPQGSLEK